MKRVVCMLVMMLMAATFGMAQKAKTDDAGLRTIIQRATAKAAMEASEEWKWEEFLGLAQIDRSLIKNYPYSDFLCYENDTRTFIALTYRDQMEEYYQGAGEVKWFKVGKVPQYRRFDPRTGWEQLPGVADETVGRLLKDGKCIKLEDFKSPIPVAERKAKLERMKPPEVKEALANFERASNEMMIYLAVAGRVSLEMTEKFARESFNYEKLFRNDNHSLTRDWGYVFYNPQKRTLKIQLIGSPGWTGLRPLWRTLKLGGDGIIRTNDSWQTVELMDLERDGYLLLYSYEESWDRYRAEMRKKLNPIANDIDNLRKGFARLQLLYKNN